MAYISIDVDTKKEIIKEYWTGKKITEIEKKYGVTRYSIRTWSKEADIAISNILKKRGVKDRISELEKENQDLKTKLEYLNKIYNNISQYSQEDLGNGNEFRTLKLSSFAKGISLDFSRDGNYLTILRKQHKDFIIIVYNVETGLLEKKQKMPNISFISRRSEDNFFDSKKGILNILPFY